MIISFDNKVDKDKLFWIYSGISSVGLIIDIIIIIEFIVYNVNVLFLKIFKFKSVLLILNCLCINK